MADAAQHKHIWGGQMIEEKYNIIFLDKKRCYKVDLGNREYNFEHTTPVYIIVDGEKIEENAWNNLIYKLAIYLNTLNPKDKEQLLLIEQDWGKQKVFSETGLSNYREFDYGLYINANHTSVHAVWTIQLLLREWKIDIKKCELVIHRMPRNEAKEVVDYYTQQTLIGFKGYLQMVTSFTDEKIDKIINALQYINDRLGEKIFKRSGYNNFLIVDDYPIFCKMKTDTMNYISQKHYDKEAFVKKAAFAMSWLDKYYKRALK